MVFAPLTPTATPPFPTLELAMKRTGLASLHEARGALWKEVNGWLVPSVYSAVEKEYAAIRNGAGLVDLSHRGKVRITGRDRISWLQGQVTQDIANLQPGQGAYATVLTPQGRMVADLRIYCTQDALLLDAPCLEEVGIAEYLERYLIMERAEIEDLTASHAFISLQGPLGHCAAATVLGVEVQSLPLHGVREATFRQERAYVCRSTRCGEDGLDVMLPLELGPPLWAALCEGSRAFAVQSVGWDALNIRRVEAGLPWWGHDLDRTIVPPEARLDHAVSLHKGCYVGQEIIARIDARGHVNNLLAGFLAEQDEPYVGAEIHHEGRKVGRITSTCRSLALGRPLALGYLRREHQEPGTRLQAVWEGGNVPLEVTSLPVIPHRFPGQGPAIPCP